jgi:hypothetical protein
MWFWKKKGKNAPKTPVTAGRIVTMPDVFYGGADPTIYPKKPQMEEKVLLSPKKVSVQQSNDKTSSKLPSPTNVISDDVPTGVKIGKPTTNAVEWATTHRSRVIVYASVVFFIVLCVITWYYVRPLLAPRNLTVVPAENQTAPNNKQISVMPTTSAEMAISALQVTTTENTTVQPASSSDSVVLDLANDLLVFPPLFLVDTTDSDRDSLSDIEESMLGTDPEVWDSDKDGYFDGQELANLYNPRGSAPIRLVDSGLVKEYANVRWQYRVYYPATWEAALVESSARQILVSAPSGDFFTATISPKKTAETFVTWFARMALGEQFSDLENFTNRFNTNMWRRRDGLVYYVDTPGAVVVMAYHPSSGSSTIAYRHIFTMMVQSFRFNSNTTMLTDQIPVPPISPSSS